MYKPAASGVWVALTEWTWNFKISITNGQFPNGNNGWNADPGTVQPNPIQTTPSGLNAFPSWSDQSFGHTWNPAF